MSRSVHSDPRAQTPLPPLTLYVLVALLHGDRHGYGIIKDVEALTDGRTRMLPGTLYRLIKQLLAEGWIVEVDGPDDDPNDDRRRYYRLTRWGKRIVNAEVERLADLVRVAEQRRGAPAPGLA